MTNTYREKSAAFQVAQGVWGLRLNFVNVFFVAHTHGDQTDWVLVDAGPSGHAGKIIKTAGSLFGKDVLPSAIVLTHGHFDHAGGLDELLETWDVPVYCHPLELPYLTGRSAYPPADPTAGGGMMTILSWIFPNRPMNLGDRLKTIDDQDRVPFLPDWRVVHTPGHSPGHISLFRQLNATLLAGDAFVTTANESLFNTITYRKKISGPPRYFTPDWWAAESSVAKLANLQPRIAASGHGPVITGKELRTGLQRLVENFREREKPKNGRYSDEPAVMDEDGVKYVPPFRTNARFNAGVFIGAAVIGLVTAVIAGKKLE